MLVRAAESSDGLAIGVDQSYIARMPSPRFCATSPVSEPTRQAQFEREAEMIAHARAQIAAGQVVTEEAFDEWVDSLGSKSELPR
jgi:predicted transcriptional regulator